MAAFVGRRRDQALQRPVRATRNATVLGIALGVSFTVCFATGLLSHAQQHPESWLTLGPRPAGLYRVTQGVHVATGLAAVPLLVAKLWAVFPRLFEPIVTTLAAVTERISLVPLVGGSLFMLFTGVANVARWYPLGFSFPAAHYWVAWITIGALIVHIGAKATLVRAALSERDPARPGPAGPPASRSPGAEPVPRRTLLLFAGGAAGVVAVTTAGQTLPLLRPVTLFAPRRPDIGPQGLPVNKAAAEAHFDRSLDDPGWQLDVVDRGVTVARFDVAALESMAQREAELPIACVEGWSATASWRGVPLAALLRTAGLDRPRAGVDVVSMERDSGYARSTLTAEQLADPDTMLALFLNGERLSPDHGYPVRLIAPNRPGVLQTKWVGRVEVAS